MTACPVAVVVVAHNGIDDTYECLASLRHLTGPAPPIFLVDQASEDGTPAIVRREFPEVTVLESGVNDGYGAGANRGIVAAFSAGVEFVLLLNNDITVAPDMLETLLAAMRAARRLGIAGPLMLRHDAPDTVWSAGGRMGPRAESSMVNEGAKVGGFRHMLPLEVDFVVGCGMLIRRAAWEAVGGFDPAYFLFYEDAGLCTRARDAEWRVMTVPAARLWHKVSRQTGKNPLATLYYMRRNALYYLARHSKLPRREIAALYVDTLRLVFVWLIRGETSMARMALRALWDYRRGRMERLGAKPAKDRT